MHNNLALLYSPGAANTQPLWAETAEAHSPTASALPQEKPPQWVGPARYNYKKAQAAVKIQHSQKERTHLAVTVHQVWGVWGGMRTSLNFCKSEESQCPHSSRISWQLENQIWAIQKPEL